MRRRWAMAVISGLLAALVSAPAGSSAPHRMAEPGAAESAVAAGVGGVPIGGPISQQEETSAVLGPLDLGPTSGPRISAIAPSPGWPADGFILAARPDGLVRTVDGGATWEFLPAPWENLSSSPSANSLRFVQSADGARVAFAIADRPGSRVQERQGRREGLYRSADDGASWQEVFELPVGARRELDFSPDFAADGLALLVTDAGDPSSYERLYRSRDGGVVWEELDPAPGSFRQALFSPDFARDRTLFAAGGTGGVLISTDVGESWAETAPAFEVSGVPYEVGRLTISPTYAEDGTLFAYAYSEPRMTLDGTQHDGRLFRSRDRGASWESVGTMVRPGVRPEAGSLALSSSFAADGTALRAENRAAVVRQRPQDASCSVSRTADGGTTWTEVVAPGAYESCAGLRLLGDGETLTGLVRKNQAWLRSTDGGLTWDRFPPQAAVRTVVPSPQFARDRTLLVGSGANGIRALGPDVRSTEGRLACPAEAGGGFGRILEADQTIRLRLGCPLAPEQVVQIRERRIGVARAFWTEDDDPTWYEATDSPPERPGKWMLHAKAEDPLPPGREQVVDGAVQRFGGGTMLFLPRPEGPRTILVLMKENAPEDPEFEAAWRELPD